MLHDFSHHDWWRYSGERVDLVHIIHIPNFKYVQQLYICMYMYIYHHIPTGRLGNFLSNGNVKSPWLMYYWFSEKFRRSKGNDNRESRSSANRDSLWQTTRVFQMVILWVSRGPKKFHPSVPGESSDHRLVMSRPSREAIILCKWSFAQKCFPPKRDQDSGKFWEMMMSAFLRYRCSFVTNWPDICNILYNHWGTFYVLCYMLSAFLQISMQVSWSMISLRMFSLGSWIFPIFESRATLCRFWLRRINRSGVQWNFHCHLEWVMVMEQYGTRILFGTKLVCCCGFIPPATISGWW